MSFYTLSVAIGTHVVLTHHDTLHVPTHWIYSSERVETRGPIVLYCSEYMRCETRGHASIVQNVRVTPGSVQYCTAQVHVSVFAYNTLQLYAVPRQITSEASTIYKSMYYDVKSRVSA